LCFRLNLLSQKTLEIYPGTLNCLDRKSNVYRANVHPKLFGPGGKAGLLPEEIVRKTFDFLFSYYSSVNIHSSTYFKQSTKCHHTVGRRRPSGRISFYFALAARTTPVLSVARLPKTERKRTEGDLVNGNRGRRRRRELMDRWQMQRVTLRGNKDMWWIHQTLLSVNP
jgi:hypothetical protein